MLRRSRKLGGGMILAGVLVKRLCDAERLARMRPAVR
jgi:hypothetical protein